MNDIIHWKLYAEWLDNGNFCVDVFCYTETRKEAQKLAETYRKQRRLDTLRVRKLDIIDRGELLQKMDE